MARTTIGSRKAAGRMFELSVARTLARYTGLDVSRRGRTMPDTGDIEGLAIQSGGKTIRLVVECKNTLEAPQIARQMAETDKETDADHDNHRDCPTYGYLVKKVPGVGMRDAESMRFQPVICRPEGDWIYPEPLYTIPCEQRRGVLELLKFMADTSQSTRSFIEWFWKGEDKDPLIVASLGLFADSIRALREKGESCA